jgi:spermidine/putrescine transport system permease protein
MDRSLEEASMDLGENKIGTFFRVILPLVTPGIISSLLISFTISLDEFIIAFFLTGTDATLPVYIWSQLRFPARLPAIMALGFLMVLLSFILLLAAEYFRRRANRIAGNPQSSDESIF